MVKKIETTIQGLGFVGFRVYRFRVGGVACGV